MKKIFIILISLFLLAGCVKEKTCNVTIIGHTTKKVKKLKNI